MGSPQGLERLAVWHLGWGHYQCNRTGSDFQGGCEGHRNEAELLCWSLSPQHLELVCLPLQLTGLTSSIAEMILGHLFSQVNGRGRQGLECFGVTSLAGIGSEVWD